LKKHINGVIQDAVKEYSQDSGKQVNEKQLKTLGKLSRIVHPLIEKWNKDNDSQVQNTEEAPSTVASS